ncbi:hypothetical protein PAXRUDRAFT_831199 [Paxillus rubicundulus Ve08.2h10]|uniref:DH domain-containing protein n=1 Tax=Paxillus rubicundulus Ve08.2h10 TaxID=930991 RepID=A0A0D0D3H9_9AGAM|nr:hypothetical protein PAXRUDRAFT_831199 [Paxillus rubicundulus Ve08.2h10]
MPISPGYNEKLPAQPPEEVISVPPPPPGKNDDHILNTHLRDGLELLPPLPTMSSLGLVIPLSPTTPLSPRGPPDPTMSISSPVEKAKKSSLLTDLIESEKSYVDLLTGIIRKVAAAWSRSNLPPPELDIMFRSVEGVYKTNRTLLEKLKEIGENPSSPKALGDLLMRWIDDLERPYTTYADKYRAGFDDWEPVKSNPKLGGVLETFSASDPPPSTVVQPSQLRDPSLWTLDALFLLPKGRLQYYRKLYSRLLKSTTPGRSDHRLLTGALGKLDGLLTTLDNRTHIKVGESYPLPPSSPVNKEKNGIPRAPTMDEFMQSGSLLSGQFGSGLASATGSTRGSFSSSGERFSREIESTSISRSSSQTMLSPIVDLEKRLATEKTLDIFTMEPKQVRLQMAPPSLPYARELRASVEVVVRLTPKATGVEVIHRRGHVYILSDLFLVCEKMTPEERGAGGVGGPDMRLCYPPLSGKVLKVTELPGQDNALQVSIMRKETLILEARSRDARDDIIKEFQECISFARTMSGAAQEPVPPLPPMRSLPHSPAVHLRPSGSPPKRERPGRLANPRLLSQPQPGADGAEWPSESQSLVSTSALSPPVSSHGLPPVTSSRVSLERKNTGQLWSAQSSRPDSYTSPPSGPASPETQVVPGDQRVPSLQKPLPGPMYPPRKSSAGQAIMDPPTSPPVSGQVIPPVRSASMQSQSPLPLIPNSDQMYPGAPGRLHSPPNGQNFPTQRLKQHASMHSLRQQPSLHHQPPMHSHYHRPLIHQSNPPPPQAPPYQDLPAQPGQYPLHGQLFTSRPPGPPGPPHGVPPPWPPSESSSSQRLQKSLSSRSLHSQYEHNQSPLPPVPSFPDSLPKAYSQRKSSIGSLNMQMSRPIPPSMQMGSRVNSFAELPVQDLSPPTSPRAELKPVGPVRSVVSAQMKCKVFHQQQHAQWKSLGTAKLTLYRQEPTNVKQLVVEADTRDKTILISTIVLTDGVERVGKTGVAIELSDAGGARTGIVYMIQLRNENSAGGLFKTLLAGSDRAT